MYETIGETISAYDEWLDERFPELEIMGLSWSPAYVLEALDPCAYKEFWMQWCDAEGIDTDELEDDYTFEWDR